MLRKASRSRLARARRYALGRARVRSQSATLCASAAACQYSQLPTNGPDGVFRDAAAQPVVRFDLGRAHTLGTDVGDDRVQPPAIQVVEGDLLTGLPGVAAHDQPHG